MFFGPYKSTQALYYNCHEGDVRIRRTVYEGSLNSQGDLNSSPVGRISVDKNAGEVGVTIHFNATGSSDPDGDALSYEWNFGDGSAISTEANPSHQYNATGTFSVSLKVTDGNGGRDTVYQEVAVGSLPKAIMTSPAKGARFAVGDTLTLTGVGEDSNGQMLPITSMVWEVQQHHNTHYHPFLDPTAGNSIKLQPAPEPEDFLAATNSFLRVLLTVTDTNGLSKTVSRDVMPKKLSLRFETIPPESDLILDDYPATSPQTVISWENHPLRVDVLDQPPYFFSKWMDSDDSHNRTIVVPPAADAIPIYIALFARADETSPRPLIISPAEGAFFAVGDRLSLAATAVDFSDNTLPDSAMVWEVQLIYGEQVRVILDRTVGNNIKLEGAPGPDDFEKASNGFLRVVLTVIDDKGRTASVSRDIYPRKQSVTFETEPPGLLIVVDEYFIAFTAPETITSWENNLFHVTAPDQPPYFFEHWSDGLDSHNRTLLVTSEGVTYTAHFGGVSMKTSAGFEKTAALVVFITVTAIGLMWML
jgi:PKD repeat protein